MRNFVAILILAGSVFMAGAYLSSARVDVERQRTQQVSIREREETRRVQIIEEERTERAWIRERGAAERQQFGLLVLLAILVLPFALVLFFTHQTRNHYYLPPPRPELPSVPPGFKVLDDLRNDYRFHHTDDIRTFRGPRG